MNFTLRQLQYFKALAEQRNFGRAAQVCHVSQPALSVQIRVFEDFMGGPLVERQARDVVLTPLGRDVLTLVDEVLGVSDRLDRLARDQSGGFRSLSLGLIPTMAPYLLPGVLAALRARDLSLRVQIREAKTEDLLAALRSGDIDAAVLALPAGSGGFAEEPLFEDRFLLAGSETRLSRLSAGPDAVRPTDLGKTQLMLLEDGHCLTDQALEVCGQQRGATGINMGASSLATLSRLVAEGFGLTLMPELAARAETASVTDLKLLRFSSPEPSRTVGLVRRKATGSSTWFADLAAVIRTVGDGIVRDTRTTAAEGGPAQGGSVHIMQDRRPA